MLGPALAILIVAYPQTAADPPPTCPGTRADVGADVFGFVRCKTTRSEIESRLGKKPVKSKDGSSDSYTFANGSVADFTFTPDGILLNEALYAEPILPDPN